MFSPTDVENAVERFLLAELSTAYKKGGAKDIIASHAHLLGLISTALVLDSDSYWYLVWLAKNRSASHVQAQLSDLSALTEAASSGGRVYRNIRSVADLTSAGLALTELSGAAGRVRTTAHPALQRARNALERFVRQHLAPNVIRGTDVVATAQEGAATADALLLSMRTRHATLVQQAQALIDAEEDFLALTLPSTMVASLISSVQERVAEISTQLSAADQAKQNSAALLDLLAARALLQRLSVFQPPSPVRLSATNATYGVGVGPELTISGGPWFIGTGRVLDLTVSGDAVSIALPTSRPVLKSQAVDETGLVSGDTISVLLDHGAGTDSYSYIILDLVDIAALITATTTNIVGTAMAVVDGVLALRRESDSPVASILVEASTSAEGNFLSWFTGAADSRGSTLEAYPTPVTAATLAALLTAAHADLQATATETLLGEFATSTWAGTTFTDARVEGTLVSTGTSATIPSGVVLTPEDAIMISGTAYEVTTVVGTLITTSPSIPAGTHPFTAGASYAEVDLNTKVRIVGNNGVALWSYVTAVSGSTLTIQGPAWDWGTSVTVQLIDQAVQLRVNQANASVPLVVAATTGASALGISAGSYYGSASTFTVDTDLLSAGVIPGDTALLTVGALEYTRTIEAVTQSQITVGTVPYDAGSWSVQILNAAYQRYLTLKAAASAFSASPTFDALLMNTAALTRGSAITGAATTAIANYQAALQTYAAALSSYSVDRAEQILQILHTLEERGLDRALDLFLAPQVSALLATEPDDLTYTTWLARTAGEVTRQVAPASKQSTDLLGRRLAKNVGGYTRPFDPTRR